VIVPMWGLVVLKLEPLPKSNQGETVRQTIVYPRSLGRSIAWLADRRRDPTPINTFTIYPCRSSRRTAAQWLACTFPYRRFADILADACARLGADVVCYSFIVVDLHHLLLARLPAHLCENSKTRSVTRMIFSVRF